MGKYCWLVLLLLIPKLTFAAVTINEVAWMGSADSANDEWIELYNDGATVDVTDWVLSDGGSLNVVLAGSILGQSYAVLERTDDSSAPGPAFLIYTGALTNAGATLFLYRSDGSIEDSVAGGTDWQNIGGDNVTKETAQYTTAGWVTDTPTPGKLNNSGRVEQLVTTKSNSNGAGSSKLGIPIPSEPNVLYREKRTPDLSISVPQQAYVNQEIVFSAKSSGLGVALLDSMEYKWNFGDLETAVGEKVFHRYAYAGTYVVYASASYKDYEAVTKSTITVLPTPIAITTNEVGDVQVHNTAKYEVDLSGYVVSAAKEIIFPNGTFLLPNSTVTIQKDKIGYVGQIVSVFDVLRKPLVSYNPFDKQPDKETKTVVNSILPTITDVKPSASLVPTAEFTFSSGEVDSKEVVSIDKIVAEPVPEAPVQPQSALALEAAPTFASHSYPYLGLVAVIVIALLGLIARGVQSSSEVQVTERSKTSPFFD